jgi:hypothetical protein
MELARRTMTLAAADLADPDGIKTTVSTSLTAVSYSGAALNGALVFSNVAEPRFGGFLELASFPTATLSNTVGAFFAASKVRWIGTYGGVAVTREASISTANGNETITGDGPMDTVTSVTVEAQQDTDGTFTFGFSGACPRRANGRVRSWWLVGGGAGNIVAGYANGQSDTLVSAAGREHPVLVSRILATTAVPVTIYELP